MDNDTKQRHIKLLEVVLKGHERIRKSADNECKVIKKLIKMLKAGELDNDEIRTQIL